VEAWAIRAGHSAIALPAGTGQISLFHNVHTFCNQLRLTFSGYRSTFLGVKRTGREVVQLEVNQSHYRPEVPRGFQEVNVPRLCDSVPGWW